MPAAPRFGHGVLGCEKVISTPDGRSLRTMVRGVGDDLVVLEAGLGVSGLYWGPVHAAVAENARVVAYERAGFGASSPDGQLRDLARLASDLEAVLAAYPHRRLVLVGHSWGGPIVRTVAARRLSRGLSPSGLVLVDQSDENAPLFFSVTARSTRAVQAAMMVPLARLRLLAPIMRSHVAGLDEPLRSATLSASTSVDAARAAKAELRHVEDELSALNKAPVELADLRIRVLSGQKAGAFESGIRKSIVEAHKRTAEQHPGGGFVPAEHSGHLIPLTEPHLIVAETLSLLR